MNCLLRISRPSELKRLLKARTASYNIRAEQSSVVIGGDQPLTRSNSFIKEIKASIPATGIAL